LNPWLHLWDYGAEHGGYGQTYIENNSETDRAKEAPNRLDDVALRPLANLNLRRGLLTGG